MRIPIQKSCQANNPNLLAVGVAGIFTEHSQGVLVGSKELAMPKATDATFVNKAGEVWWVWIKQAALASWTRINKSPELHHFPTPTSSHG